MEITHGTLAASITLHELAWQNLNPTAADPDEVVVESSNSGSTPAVSHGPHLLHSF